MTEPGSDHGTFSPGNEAGIDPAYRAASNEVCACLSETGSRQVEIVERCVRCGLCMDSDAYGDVVTERDRLREALERIVACDYRGNMPTEQAIARKALGGHQ